MKNMKSIELFCASPASTAICSSMDQRAIIRPGTRPIDKRLIHRLGEPPRSRTSGAPCSSQLPMDPACRPCYHKGRKSTSSVNETERLRRKSSANAEEVAISPRSSRYLLSDKPYVDFILNNERSLVPSQSVKEMNVKGPESLRDLRSLSTQDKSLALRLSDHLKVEKSNSPVKTNNQVVQLRVSIHCKGCEGKLRKHIARMEGVKSFSIDLETKKVTIIGDVTPLGVLSSISKVKNAQFWPSPANSSSSSSSRASTPRLSLTR